MLSNTSSPGVIDRYQLYLAELVWVSFPIGRWNLAMNHDLDFAAGWNGDRLARLGGARQTIGHDLDFNLASNVTMNAKVGPFVQGL